MAPRNTLPAIPGGSSLLRDAMRGVRSAEAAKLGPCSQISASQGATIGERTKCDSEADFERRAHSKVKVPFNLPADLAESIRDAVFALSGPPHCLSLALLAENALRAELARLEEAENSGQRFLARQGRLRPGRRVS